VIAGLWLCAGCARPESRLPALPYSEVAVEQRLQQIAHIRDYYTQLARVQNVGFNIKVANRPFCKDVSPQIGLHAATVQSLPRRYRSYTNEALQLSWTQPTAISVAERSPAAIAGIKQGDRILTLDNVQVPPTGTQRWIDERLVAGGGQPVKIMVRRDGEDSLRTVYPVIACAIPVVYEVNPAPGAYTDYRRIVIQAGLLRVVASDDDLATVIGHELAHVTLDHGAKRRQNVFIGEFGGALIDGGLMLTGVYSGKMFSREFKKMGALAYSAAFEREADYVGAYFAARAGYDISGGGDVWRRMAMEGPAAIAKTVTHPITPVRVVQMQKVAAEIAAKRRQGLPLVPDMQAAGEPAPAESGT